MEVDDMNTNPHIVEKWKSMMTREHSAREKQPSYLVDWNKLKITEGLKSSPSSGSSNSLGSVGSSGSSGSSDISSDSSGSVGSTGS